jgi:predicted secreted Zn-dependent protease
MLSFEWRKATGSYNNGCVEVAHRPGYVVIRDSKNPNGPVLTFDATEWQAFLDGVKANEFEIRETV